MFSALVLGARAISDGICPSAPPSPQTTRGGQARSKLRKPVRFAIWQHNVTPPESAQSLTIDLRGRGDGGAHKVPRDDGDGAPLHDDGSLDPMLGRDQ